MRDIVLLTGATGFIGGHLARELVRLGRPVRCLVRRDFPLPGVETVRCDLAGGGDLVAALDGVSMVIHLAGTTKALEAGEYRRGNEIATRRLVAACRPDVRFVYVSSLAAAGPSPDGSLLREDAPPHPVSQYGRSKLAAEAALRESAVGAGAVILRPAVVYGPGDRDVLQVFQAVSRGVMAGIGTLDSQFSYIYVDDLVRAILMAAEGAGSRGGTYFVANSQPVSWRGFAQAIALALNRPQPRMIALPPALAYGAGLLSGAIARLRGTPAIFSRDKVREGVHRYWVCDTSQAASGLGFLARTPLEEGIAACVSWYRSKGWLR